MSHREIRPFSPAVAVTDADPFVVDESVIHFVIGQAKTAPKRRARLLLHQSQDELLHEMLIALPKETCDVPHINYKSGKSFLVVSGRMVCMIFSDDGARVSPYALQAQGSTAPFMLRLNAPVWHTIIPLTDYVVFLESISGPFVGNRFAEWAPKDTTSAEGQHFARRLRALAGEGNP